MAYYEKLEEAGIPVRRYKFSGSGSRSSDAGFPTVTGGYSTVANGWGENFTVGAPIVGNWVKVYEHYSEGDEYYFSSFVAYYVPVEHATRAIEMLREMGGSDHIFYADVPSVEERTNALRTALTDRIATAPAADLDKAAAVLLQ